MDDEGGQGEGTNDFISLVSLMESRQSVSELCIINPNISVYRMPPVFDIIVVGAGVAGLKCAGDLRDRGFSVLVIEGKEDVGGRVRSDVLRPIHSIRNYNYNDGSVIEDHSERNLPAAIKTTIDVGAAWVHGDKGNPLLSLISPDTLRIVTPRNPWMRPNADWFHVTVNRHVLPTSDVDAGIALFHSIMENVAADIPSLLLSDPSLYSKDLHSAFNKYLLTVSPPTQPEHVIAVAKWCLWLIGCWMGFGATRLQHVCFDYDWTALRASDDDDGISGDYPGSHCVTMGGMYKNLIVPLLSGGRDKGVHLQCHTSVTHVQWTQQSSTNTHSLINIHCNNGVIYQCHVVVVTVSVGVLQANTITFTPPLPEQKQSSIRRLAMGSYKKIAIRFNERTDGSLFPPQGLPPFIVNLNLDNDFSRDGSRLFHTFNNYRNIKDIPVLEAILVGDEAQEAKSFSDEQCVTLALVSIKHMFGSDISIPSVHSYYVTNWESDPFTRGAYSFSCLGSSGDDNDILGDDSCWPVLFAGEACDRVMAGSLHAALTSATTVADMIHRKYHRPIAKL